MASTCTRFPVCPRRSSGSPRSPRSTGTTLDPEAVEATLGVALKSKDDIDV